MDSGLAILQKVRGQRSFWLVYKDKKCPAGGGQTPTRNNLATQNELIYWQNFSKWLISY